MWQKMSVLESESAEDTACGHPSAGSLRRGAQGLQEGTDLKAALTDSETLVGLRLWDLQAGDRHRGLKGT